MGLGIGAGLVEGLQAGDQNARANKGLEAQLAEEHAQTQATTDADARAQALAPGEVTEQGDRIGLLTDQDAQAKQSLSQGAQSFTTDQKQKNGAIAMQQMQLTHEQFEQMHENALATAKILNNGLGKKDGAVDTNAVESVFNEGAPQGHRIMPGTLKVNRADDPMQSTITYQGDDGKPHSSTLQQWNTYATAFLPPPKTEALNSDQRLVNSQSGDVVVPASGPGMGKIDPVTYNNSVARQVATNNGGLFDENGNLKLMDPKLSAKVAKLSGIASQVGQQTGFSIPAATVASAVQSVSDSGVDADDPKFIPAVQAKLQGGGGGYGLNQNQGQNPTTAPAAGSFPQAPTDPTARTNGTVYQTPKGPAKWMGNGWALQGS